MLDSFVPKKFSSVKNDNDAKGSAGVFVHVIPADGDNPSMCSGIIWQHEEIEMAEMPVLSDGPAFRINFYDVAGRVAVPDAGIDVIIRNLDIIGSVAIVVRDSAKVFSLVVE
jgi:hypothetical protein